MGNRAHIDMDGIATAVQAGAASKGSRADEDATGAQSGAAGIGPVGWTAADQAVLDHTVPDTGFADWAVVPLDMPDWGFVPDGGALYPAFADLIHDPLWPVSSGTIARRILTWDEETWSGHVFDEPDRVAFWEPAQGIRRHDGDEDGFLLAASPPAPAFDGPLAVGPADDDPSRVIQPEHDGSGDAGPDNDEDDDHGTGGEDGDDNDHTDDDGGSRDDDEGPDDTDDGPDDDGDDDDPDHGDGGSQDGGEGGDDEAGEPDPPSGNTPPWVTATGAEIMRGDRVALDELIDAGDADGDAITVYRLYDPGDDGHGPGFIQVRGPREYNGEYIEVTDLDRVEYHAAGPLGSESLLVQVYDGEAWSDWQSLEITSVARPAPGRGCAPAVDCAALPLEAEAAEPDLGVLLGGFDTAPVSGPDWTFLAEAAQPGDWDEVGNGNPFA